MIKSFDGKYLVTDEGVWEYHSSELITTSAGYREISPNQKWTKLDLPSELEHKPVFRADEQPGAFPPKFAEAYDKSYDEMHEEQPPKTWEQIHRDIDQDIISHAPDGDQPVKYEDGPAVGHSEQPERWKVNIAASGGGPIIEVWSQDINADYEVMADKIKALLKGEA